MNVLAFFAHPDDETMLSGGVLALLAEKGAKVHYLCATRGEGGEVGEPPLGSRQELGQVRQAEMECAVKALGGASLTFLDFIDPTVGVDNQVYAFAASPDKLAGLLTKKAHEVDAQAILSHGSNGEYGHPAHKLVYEAARLAVDAIGPSAPELYTVSALFPGHPRPRLANKDDPADLIVDVAAVFQCKLSAAACHRTQHALFLRHAPEDLHLDHPAALADVIIKKEGLHRVSAPSASKLEQLLMS